MMKKLALLLALALSLTVFALIPASAEEKPIELTYVDRYGEHNWDTTILFQRLEEKFNVKITRKPYASVEGTTWFTLAILSGDTPAYISDLSPNDMVMYARQGLFKELDLDMIRKQAPEMCEWWADEWLENWADYGIVDGKLYAVPVLWSLSNHWNTVVIREDMCEELGMEVPHTLDDLEAFMAAAKEKYGMDYVLSVPSMGYLDFVLGAYDVYRGVYFKGNDGELYWWIYHPNAKMAVSRLADWYAKGYIDPEFATAGDDVATERFASGKSAVTASYWCNFVEAGTWGSSDGAMLAALKEISPDAKLAWVGTPSTEYGNGGWNASPWTGWFVFSKELSDEQIAKYFEVFNYCSQTYEGACLAYRGVEGVHYTVDDDNMFTWLEAADTEEERAALGIGVNFPGNFNNYAVQYPFFTSNSMSENRHYWEDNNYTRANALAARPRELAADWGTAFGDYCSKNLFDFITSVRSLDEWDSFISEASTQYHGTELVEEARATLASIEK